MKQLGLFTDKFALTPTGLVVEGKPDFEEWMDYGVTLKTLDGTSRQFAIGDWIVHGFDTYEHGKWEAVQQVWDGQSLSTLQQYERVSKSVKSCNRLQDLSWTHHHAIADLESDKQRHWLEQAAEHKWSVSALRKAMTAPKEPRLYVGRAEDMHFLDAESVDVIITSPPYNLGSDNMPMGGNGRTPREDGIGYDQHGDSLPESQYQAWQLDCLKEMYRVARDGASLFYNHKVRIKDGRAIHPMAWIGNSENPWTLRQEIIWDRGSTHNHSASLFWPHDERIYWMTKGRPRIESESIGRSTIWKEHGPVAGTWHPAPFTPGLPQMCFDALGLRSAVILDPFAGSCTTVQVALEYGYDAIGVDISQAYLDKAVRENGWMKQSVT